MSSGGSAVSSSSLSLSVAEEETPRVLPANPEWVSRRVNAYPSFGGQPVISSPEVIGGSRQNQFGSLTDFDASGGATLSMTIELTNELQGFFFADVREKPSTSPFNGTPAPLTSVTATQYRAGSGLSRFPVGALVFAEGFASPANNGLSMVTGSTATTLTTDNVKAAEASPTGNVHMIGLEFATGDLALTVAAGRATLTSTASAFTNLPLNVGEWVFVGGDDAGNRFDIGYGYARVREITDAAIVIDSVAWIGNGGVPGADIGTGKSIRIFADAFLRNEEEQALIKCRSYQLERTLGDDDNGTQSQYLTGSFANELVLNLPLSNFHDTTLNYVCLSEETRDGADGLKAGTRTAFRDFGAYNTSSNIFRSSLTLLDETTLSPVDLFAFSSEAAITVNNGITSLKALGTVGGFDVNVGNFGVSGTVTAYFQSVAAIEAIRAVQPAQQNIIVAANNRGVVYDLPLISAGGGQLNVQVNSPVTIPIETTAAESPLGYTMSYTAFRYLPTVAMPVQ